MNKGNEKLSKASRGKLAKWLVAGAVLCVLLAIIIANLFFPLKYIGTLFVASADVQAATGYVNFLDVGYGDCTFVRLPDGKTMLIDGGNGNYATRCSILMELKSYGVDSVDYMICTSVKSEHCGGLAEVLTRKHVKKLFVPYVTYAYITQEYHALYTSAQKAGVEQVVAEYGVHEEGENWFFTFLSPTDHSLDESEYTTMNSEHGEKNSNNASAVLWLEIYGTKFLFMGDALSTVEDKIYTEYALRMELEEEYCTVADKSVRLADCDVLKVSAHGSSDAVNENFYSLFSLQAAVISVGKNSRSCPAIEVISDLSQFTKQTYNTQNDGDIRLVITEKGMQTNS